jgi:pyrrolidone-carboxylate peptidase
MKKVLITGFEAFEPLEKNPSRKIVEELDGKKSITTK